MRSDVVALYVDPRAPYPELVEEWYGEERDARTYSGALPVVAHPPCGPWSVARHLCEHEDDGRMRHAVAIVRRCGGVLEQPRGSRAFAAFGVPLPGAPPDAFGGRTVEVEQVRWGRVARKRTWVYVVGTPGPFYVPPPRAPTHWCSAHRYSSRGGPERRVDSPPEGVKVCSAQQRSRTPRAFAEWLLDIAAKCARSSS